MSLISDALKRTQQNTAARAPSPRPQPVQGGPAGNLRLATVTHGAPHQMAAEKPRYGAIVVLLGVLVVLAAGGFGYLQLRPLFAERARAISEITAPPKPAATITPTVTAPLEKLVASSPSPVPTAQPVRVDVPKVESPVSAPPKPEPKPIPPAVRPLPKLVLQGVTVQGGLREALIDGQAVVVGDVIEEARVLVIEPRSVKMQFDGREFVLRLP